MSAKPAPTFASTLSVYTIFILPFTIKFQNCMSENTDWTFPRPPVLIWLLLLFNCPAKLKKKLMTALNAHRFNEQLELQYLCSSQNSLNRAHDGPSRDYSYSCNPVNFKFLDSIENTSPASPWGPQWLILKQCQSKKKQKYFTFWKKKTHQMVTEYLITQRRTCRYGTQKFSNCSNQ